MYHGRGTAVDTLQEQDPLLKLINKYIPPKLLRGNKTQKPWISGEVKSLMWKRDKLNLQETAENKANKGHQELQRNKSQTAEGQMPVLLEFC